MDHDSPLTRRIERLEAWRDDDNREHARRRHEARNEFTEALNRVQLRVLALEKAPPPELGWGRWALGVAGAVIAFLAAMVWGKK